MAARECSICQNAYGTRYVCKACKADLANVDWREAPKAEVAFEWIPDGAKATPWVSARDVFSVPLFRSVVLLLATERHLHLRAVARELGCTEGYVRKVVSTLKALRKPQ